MKHVVVSFVVALTLSSQLAMAQHWPKPDVRQNVEVPCAGCLGQNNGLPTLGYSGAIRTFVGRFADSTTTRDYQATFRTARSGVVRFAPERNRIYMALGSAVAAYSLDSFFGRLAAHEPLVPSTSAPVTPINFRSGEAEVYLRWDKFFYAEFTKSGWVTPLTDGQDRLYSFDWDDRGYLYIGTSSYFGWGVVYDDGSRDGGLMPTWHQEYPPDGYSPSSVISVKSSAGRYFLIVPGVTASAVWDVTNPSTPIRQHDLNVLFGPVVKLTDGRIAVLGVNGLAVYSVDSLLAGSGADFSDSSSTFLDVSTDGTNLFAISNGSGTAYLTTFAPDQAAHFVSRRFQLATSFQPANVHCGGSYLAVGGTYGDVRVFKLDSNLTPTELPTNGYLGRYYGSGTPAGYAHPDFTTSGVAYPYTQGSTVYLIVAAHGLGDVYEIKGNAAPQRRRAIATDAP
jgi:hypothetical protein